MTELTTTVATASTGQKWVRLRQVHTGANEIVSVKKKFLSLQEETLRALRREEREVSPEEKEFVVCPELECPVCLQEMLPPTRIWQCW